MGLVSLKNLHPDLKLGLVLVSAAALLKFVGWSSFAAERSYLTAVSYGWLFFAFGIGGLAAIPVAIWVDRRPPHTMMAVGAIVAAVGLTIVVLSNGVAVAAFGMFVMGVGSSAFGSLVFYAIAVKGVTRYRGTLIGALGVVFTVPLNLTNIVQLFHVNMPVLWIGLALALAGAAVLLRLLPRVFAGSYEPGLTLRETLAVPDVRRAVAWMTAAFFVASMITFTAALEFYNFSNLTNPSFARDDVALQQQTLRIFTVVGILVWGIASDFYPGRRLFLVAGLLLLPATGLLWASYVHQVPAVGTVGLGLVRGGLVCLPWVLMAELLPTRHFAKIALGVMFVGSLVGGTLGPILWGGLTDIWGTSAIFWFIPILGSVLALVASRLPRTRATEPTGNAISKT